jgi:hypothetical protein
MVVSTDEIAKDFTLEPTYEYSQNSKFNSRYAPNGIDQSLTLTYNLTGADFIKDYISNEGFISGNFAGLSFHSGVLRSYSFSARPNSPIVINAEIGIYDNIAGVFTTVSSVATTKPILNFSDASIESDSGRRFIDNLESLSFNYSAEIESHYEINNNTGLTFIQPARVTVGKQNLDVSIVCDNYDFDLNIFGLTGVGVRINCNHPYLTNPAETFLCSGILTAESLGAGNNDLVKKVLTIKTNQPGEPPVITNILPSPLIPNSSYTINGRNLSGPLYVNFGDRTDNFPRGINSTQILGTVPRDVISGAVELITVNGRATFASPLYQFPTISIFSVSPPSGLSIGRQGLKEISITGSNFDRIDRVLFNYFDTDYNIDNASFIRASIPSGIENDYIRVVSTLRNKSGASPFRFFTHPRIDSFNPTSGKAGDTILITGYNFNDIEIIRFGETDTTNFSVVSSRAISATLPAGSTRGRVGVHNLSGLSSNRPWFSPYLLITGGYNITGAGLNTPIHISGVNFDVGIMYPTGADDRYWVKLGNTEVGFKRVSDNTLTGMLTVTGDYNGRVKIPSEGRLVEYDSPFNFRFFAPPTIDSITNIVSRFGATAQATSGKTFKATIKGTNLDLVTGVMITGSGINGADLYIRPPYYYSNTDGTQGFITGFKPFGPPAIYHTVVRSPYGEDTLNSQIRLIPQPNLATLGTHTQSSDYFTAELCRAYVGANTITGGSSGNYGISLTQTETNPWWQVRFAEGINEIDRIVIYNSTGIEKTGLSQFVIKVMGDNFETTMMSGIHSGDNLYPDTREEYRLFQTVSGRYVRIHLTGTPAIPEMTRWLGLGEVEVY